MRMMMMMMMMNRVPNKTTLIYILATVSIALCLLLLHLHDLHAEEAEVSSIFQSSRPLYTRMLNLKSFPSRQELTQHSAHWSPQNCERRRRIRAHHTIKIRGRGNYADDPASVLLRRFVEHRSLYEKRRDYQPLPPRKISTILTPMAESENNNNNYLKATTTTTGCIESSKDVDVLRQALAKKMGWETREKTIQIGSSNTSSLTCHYRLLEVINLDDLLDNIIENGGEALEDDRIPYWIEVWPSAVALSEEILSNEEIRYGTSVIEVGCGLGLCSMTAGQKGASVLQTDYIQEALDMANIAWMMNEESTIEQKQQHSIPSPAPSAASTSLNELKDVHDHASSPSLDNPQKPRQMLLDWRYPEVLQGQQFDVLLASDVAYEERAFKPLIAAFKSLVKPGGKVYLSEPNRAIARSWTRNLKELAREGLELTSKTNRTVWLSNQMHTVTIYELTKL
mmetsp:Transcript_14405/g.23486  ORF Transcript_14405/g.23486 Transcript_14405/m.23486 type:complete len:453 (+) Transcript_14405:154-1512(+)